MLGEESMIFVVYIAALEVSLLEMTIYFLQKTKIAILKQNKALSEVPTKYSDFSNFFSEKKALVQKRTQFNQYVIKLEKDNQPHYKPIYSLGLIELETLKTNIKTHLKTEFIQPSKFPASAFILFNKKPDNSLCLCVNYWGLNNFIIKN